MRAAVLLMMMNKGGEDAAKEGIPFVRTRARLEVIVGVLAWVRGISFGCIYGILISVRGGDDV